MRLAPCAPCPISSSTDLLVVLLLGLEAVVNGLEPQVDVGEIVEPLLSDRPTDRQLLRAHSAVSGGDARR
ncbi:hypothetical protein F2P81_022552 [Scophthalmus maximus]|uniref:Uncharacterized protein n=1 Tax=Scophthalmus maximus TaxID=52904 RepID=A0A6A4S3C1_SCOMX|nr:hypothetical protein F2P81_022552 [Scophthalmus maximus]